MALTITKLKMWKNPGYTRECAEVPPAGSRKLPTPDYVNTGNLRPRKNGTISAIELPLSYCQVFDMSYLYMEFEDSSHRSVNVFGWIESIEQTASSDEAVLISWSVDWWRTYSGSVTFGKGTITRCADAAYKRPYLSQPRKWMVDSITTMYNLNYTFVMMVSTTFSQTVSVEFPPGSGNTFPVEVKNVTKFAYFWGDIGDTGTGYRTPTLAEIYSGALDEILGNDIAPSSIVGCWLLPGSAGAYYGNFTGTSVVTNTYNGDTIRFYKSTGVAAGSINTVHDSRLNGKGSDDMRKCVAVDPYGNITGIMPWGFSFRTDSTYYTLLDISPDGITIYLFTDSDFWNCMMEGSYLMFRALRIPVNSNEWSEYAYSGQAEFDRRTKELQREQQMWSGVANIGQTTMTGAVGGAMAGKGAGSIIGAAAGATLGLVSPFINEAISAHYDNELMSETYKLVSNQTSNVMQMGTGLAWTEIMKTWCVVVLKADTVSQNEYDQHITNDGYTVEIPVSSASSFIAAGGALQIQNLTITGAIPPRAKTYIINKLSNGVRIIENNPSGVVP